MFPVIDLNGVQQWSAQQIEERYLRYADRLGVVAPAPLVPTRYQEADRTWVYPLMQVVIQLAETGDAAAIELCLEMIEEDDFLWFGYHIKSDAARALRRQTLSEQQKERIRQRLVAMVLAGWVPKEFREYKRLLRKVEIGHLWPKLTEGVNRENDYVMRYYSYFVQFASK